MAYDRRLGVIVPSSNTTVETEFYELLKKHGYTLHAARISLSHVTIDSLAEMEKGTINAARQLNDAEVQSIAYACTTGSLFKGLGHDEELRQRIMSVSSCPAIVTSGSVLKALMLMGAKTISVVTPYIDSVNEKEREFLEQGGIEIVDFIGMHLTNNTDIGRVSRNMIMKEIDSLDTDGADVIFLSCTNMPTFDVIEEIEDKTGLPVVSSNSATLFDIVSTLGIKDFVGPGKLFGMLRTKSIQRRFQLEADLEKVIDTHAH